MSLYPALEGRFPQVSAITFDFDGSMPPFKRVKSACIGGLPIKLDAEYLLATRDYMARGKDGYTSLAGDDVEVVVGPEEGDRIYKIVLDASSRLQSPCGETRSRIYECSEEMRYCTARSASSGRCWVPTQCDGMRSLSVAGQHLIIALAL